MSQGSTRNVISAGVSYNASSLTASNVFTFSSTTSNVIKINSGLTSSIYLPDLPITDSFYIVKNRHNASVSPITVYGNTKLIDGESFIIMDMPTYVSFLFLYDGTEYIII